MISKRKFSDDEKKRVYNLYEGKCAICGEPVSRKKMTISHKVPLSRGGTNGISNLMLACWTCNHMKNNLELEEFFRKIDQIQGAHQERNNQETE